MTSQDTAEIERIALSHGQARWVLATLGLGDDERRSDAYLKSLRKDGLPFADDEVGMGAGNNAIYRYEHLMELAVALALRTQAILPRHIVHVLAQHRALLRKHYRRAWLERDKGLGAGVDLLLSNGERLFRAGGTYLDLQLIYDERGHLGVMSPKLLAPAEAMKRFGTHYSLMRPRLPLPVSQFAEDIVRLARGVPEMKRGRQG
jgi:hypothetical protein